MPPDKRSIEVPDRLLGAYSRTARSQNHPLDRDYNFAIFRESARAVKCPPGRGGYACSPSTSFRTSSLT